MNKVSNGCGNSKEQVRIFEVIGGEGVIKLFILGDKDKVALILAQAIKKSEGIREILNNAFVLADLGKVTNVEEFGQSLSERR